jgi:cell division protein FtsQ
MRQIEQLFVNDKADIELIPRVGNQRIVLGSADSLEVKMRNLLAFYKQAMPKVGWDTYKTINVKYTNQVVCVKSKPDSVIVNGVKRPKIIDTLKSNKAVVDQLVLQQIAMEMKNDGDDPDQPDGAVAPPPKPVKPVLSTKPAITKTTKPATAKTTKPAVAKTVKKKVTPPVKKVTPPVKKATVKPAAKPATTKPAKAVVKKPVKTVAKKPGAAKENSKTDTKKNK